LHGESPLNKDFYTNLKAPAWWELRRRFEKTHRAVTEGIEFSRDEMISIPSDLPLLRTLQKELSQPTMSKGTRMRLVIDKAPEGTRSPNLADAIVMAYWPVGDGLYESMSWV
jgi:phage terminase large subunit